MFWLMPQEGNMIKMKNILNKFTLRSLKLNIKRTIATCIGIILSTALICAVAGVFSSFQQTLIQHAIKADGDYHTIFFGVPKDEQKYILENRNVESAFVTQGVGYAKLEGGTNKYKPYLYLFEFDETALSDFGLKLIEGRVPENSNELLISQHIEENGGVKYKIGDKIKLDIGKRITDDGVELNQNNPYNNSKDKDEKGYIEEKLETEETREFTIVGIIQRPNSEIEEYSAPGYTIITKLDEIKDNANIAVKFKNIKDTYKLTREIAEDPEHKSSEDSEFWVPKYGYSSNSELLRWSGVIRSESTITMLYTLAGIVIGIIVISSVFVIRNSFAISITEKMKQYGMFSSIGATRKQIKKNVLFEGMVLGIISIPLGILGGIFATFVLTQISTLLVGKSVFSEEIVFVFNMPIFAIILSIILGFVTIFISCIFSARRASRISPIDAIRSNEDIKIKAKKIKSPKIIRKIFGVGGEIAYKNLKRNKKKYRTTVISLVVSITVFITLTTFMNYAFGMSGIYYTDMDYNVRLRAYSDESKQDGEKVYEYYKDIISKHNIKDYSLKRYLYLEADLSDKYTDEVKESFAEQQTIAIKAIGKDEYNEYLKKIGANYDDCKDGIIYFNNSVSYDDNVQIKKAVDFKENDIIEGTIQDTDKTISLKIVKIADKDVDDVVSYSSFGIFIISDELIEKIGNYSCASLTMNVGNPDKLCKEIQEEHDNLPKDDRLSIDITNYKEQADEQKNMVILISIFLYGFIVVITLIGVTNIFNTITTNMNLRSKEFAMLKSVGMTKKEFNKMINLESIFYGVKSLVIGIALGTGISYWIYRVVIGAESTSSLKFLFPGKAIAISIVFIAVIVGIIMKYSLSKINKQNIIETIRNENI